MGKGGGAQQSPHGLDAEAERLAKIQADQSQNLFRASAPLREGTLERMTQALQGSNDPIALDFLTNTPAFGAFKQSNELAFDRARQRTIESTPAGGALSGALGNIEAGRAGAFTQGVGALSMEEINRRERNLDRSLNASLGFPGLSLSGLGSAGSSLGQLSANQAAIAESQANRDAGKSSGAGQAAGSIAAAMITRCSREFKTDIEDVSDSDMLAKVNATYVARWRYRPEYLSDAEPIIGPIAEESPTDFTTGDGKGVYEMSLIGALMCSVRELTRRLEVLEGR